jgi:hypothetical protein
MSARLMRCMDERLRFVARVLEGEKMAPNGRVHAHAGGDPSETEAAALSVVPEWKGAEITCAGGSFE